MKKSDASNHKKLLYESEECQPKTSHNNKWFDVFEYMLTMVGSVVGVGFLTGAEVQDFFARFGKNSLIGIMVVVVLFFVMASKMFEEKQQTKKCIKMQKFDKVYAKNTFLNKNNIKNFLVFFNLLMISGAMISGLKRTLFNLLKHNYHIVFLICVIFVFVLLIFGFKGLSKFNYFVIVFAIFVLFFACKRIGDCSLGFCFKTNVSCENFVMVSAGFGARNVAGIATLASVFLLEMLAGNFEFGLSVLAGVMAVIYVFMNIVEVQPVVEESPVTLTKKQAKWFCFVFAVVVAGMICVLDVFLNNNPLIAENDMPMMAFFDGSPLLGKVFCVGLVCALLSTLLVCLIGVKARLVAWFEYIRKM